MFVFVRERESARYVWSIESDKDACTDLVSNC